LLGWIPRIPGLLGWIARLLRWVSRLLGWIPRCTRLGVAARISCHC